MLQMGGDFGFGDANAWFKNLDILLAAVNKEGRVHVSEPITRSQFRVFAWVVLPRTDTHTGVYGCLTCYGAGVSSFVGQSARLMLFRNNKLLRLSPLG